MDHTASSPPSSVHRPSLVSGVLAACPAQRRGTTSYSASSHATARGWKQVGAGGLKGVILSALLLTGVGCNGPTCQTACEKAFNSCGMDNLTVDGDAENPLTLTDKINNCTAACSQDMQEDLQEAEAVGWVSCVETFVCSSAEDAASLCLTCSAGYYAGRTEGATCGTAEQTIAAWTW